MKWTKRFHLRGALPSLTSNRGSAPEPRGSRGGPQREPPPDPRYRLMLRAHHGPLSLSKSWIAADTAVDSQSKNNNWTNFFYNIYAKLVFVSPWSRSWWCTGCVQEAERLQWRSEAEVNNQWHLNTVSNSPAATQYHHPTRDKNNTTPNINADW